MQGSRCLRAATHRQILPHLPSVFVDTLAVGRYKAIRNFFRQQVIFDQLPAASLATPKPRPHCPRNSASLHAFRASDTASPIKQRFATQARSFHVVPRREEKKQAERKNAAKDSESVTGSQATDSDLAKEQRRRRDEELATYSRLYRRLAMSLPLVQRPTRDDLLKVATNFWERLRIRFKWFTIKSFRRFNADDISAFFTWFIMSQTVWILVGTTTFFSVVFATLNSLRLQENVARTISDYLTAETGITIIFESAIVPKWKDSRIAFKNVYVSRRPPSLNNAPYSLDHNATHRAVARYDIGNHPASHGLEEESPLLSPPPPAEEANYSMFDLNIDSVDVTLSLWRWLDGKGLVKDASIKGVRGVLDRRFIYYDPDKPLNPSDFRHAAQPGDFELESLQMEDFLVTVHQPDRFRPYTFSIFRADLKTFRKKWMFHDFLRAENVVGQFDNCLFSLHKPQSIGRTTKEDLKDTHWSRMARFRIDGVNVDHLQRATTMEGPITWITSGKVDAVFDIRFPQEEDEKDINVLLGELAEVITAAASTQAARLFERIPGQRELAQPAISPPEDAFDLSLGKTVDPAREQKPRHVTIDIDLRFRDVKASVPLFSRDLSYANSALIRPIVAFINANRTLVPMHCRIVKDIEDFDGAWTMWETGLVDDIAIKVYDALAYHVTQANFNRRVRTVSLWSLQKTVAATLSTLEALIRPLTPNMKLLENPDPISELGNLAA